MPNPICQNWDENVCKITFDKSDKPEKQGGFFCITGKVRNVNASNCDLPHLRLNVTFLDVQGKPLEVGVLGEDVKDPNERGNVIHVTDRAISPNETVPFKFEGIWDDRINKVVIKTRPKGLKTLAFAPSIPEGLILKKVNTWQDEISLGGVTAVIQRGDIILDAGPAQGVSKVFCEMITNVTNSPYHHAMLYDCSWNVVHATWPEVESNSLENLYLNRPDAVLTWVRPKFKSGKAVTESDAKKTLKFALDQKGHDYDMIANAGFLFRADGLPGVPAEMEKLFQNRDWLNNQEKWFCSELASGAWWYGAKLELVEDMLQKDFLSPADIYTSVYHDIVCTLMIKGGKAELHIK